MHLLGSTITAALVPLKSSIEDISAHLHTVEDTQNWVPGQDDSPPEDYAHGYDIPTHRAQAGGEEHVDDYHTVSAPSCANAKDAKMEDACKRFESHNDNEDPHLYFKVVVLNACNQPRNEFDPAHLAALADIVVADWDDFCSSMFLDCLQVPPIPVVGDAFITCMCMLLVKLQLEDDLRRALHVDDLGHPVSPTGPSFTGPFLTASKGDAGPDMTTDPPTHLSKPISILSDRTKISRFTKSSPSRTRPIGSALDLDTPPPGDGPSWKLMGGKHGQSFASIAASHPNAPATPATLPPSAAAAAHSFLTKPQLDSLTQEQVIGAYNARFTLKLGLRVPKECAVTAFLDKASHPTPTPPPCPQTDL